MPWVLLVLSWGLLAMVLLRLRVRPLNMEVGRARLPGGWIAGLLAFCGLPMVFFTAMTVLCLQHGENAGIFPGMALLAALSAGFVGLPCIRWNAEGMSVRNMLGWTRFIPWTGVHGWYWDGGNLWLKTVVGRIFLPPIMDNREALLNAAQAHVPSPDETPLPLIPDLFRGRVRHPAQLLATLVLLVSVGGLMTAQGAAMVLTADASAKNTQVQTVVFEEYERYKSGFFALTAGESTYLFCSSADESQLRGLSGSGDAITVWVRPELSDSYAVCRAEGTEGTVYLDFEDYNHDRQARGASELLMGLVLLLVAALAVWVFRWPERSPAWLRKLLPAGILAEEDGI